MGAISSQLMLKYQAIQTDAIPLPVLGNSLYFDADELLRTCDVEEGDRGRPYHTFDARTTPIDVQREMPI